MTIKTIKDQEEVRFIISQQCIKANIYDEVKKIASEIFCVSKLVDKMSLGIHEDGRAACVFYNNEPIFQFININEINVEDTRSKITIDDRRKPEVGNSILFIQDCQHYESRTLITQTNNLIILPYNTKLHWCGDKGEWILQCDDPCNRYNYLNEGFTKDANELLEGYQK